MNRPVYRGDWDKDAKEVASLGAHLYGALNGISQRSNERGTSFLEEMGRTMVESARPRKSNLGQMYDAYDNFGRK